MHRVIAILFLFVFMLQVLPVRSLGKMLVKAQQTEQTDSDDCSDDDGIPSLKFTDFIHHQSPSFSLLVAARTTKRVVMHINDGLPVSHSTEVLSPPPNC